MLKAFSNRFFQNQSGTGQAFYCTVGFMAGGPLGAFVGAAFGHSLDQMFPSLQKDTPKQERRNNPANAALNDNFFYTTFLIMGLVSRDIQETRVRSIRRVEEIMTHMNLTTEQQLQAIRLYFEGKKLDFDIYQTLNDFHRVCQRRVSLINIFIEVLIQSVYSESAYCKECMGKIEEIAQYLQVNEYDMAQIKALVRSYYRHNQRNKGNQITTLSDAYRVLGVERSACANDIKMAYRRLMNRHHPDKLIARGFPEEMCEIANEKIHEIQAAYEKITSKKK